MEVMMIILCLLWKTEPPSEGARSFYLWGTVSKNCILTAKQRAIRIEEAIFPIIYHHHHSMKATWTFISKLAQKVM